MPWRANRRLVTTPDGSRILRPEEEQTGRLLAAEGGMVSDEDCVRYGLGPNESAKAPETTVEAPKPPDPSPKAAKPPKAPPARGVGLKTPPSTSTVRGGKR